MNSAGFQLFQKDIVSNLVSVLALENWVVESADAQESPLSGTFSNRLLKTINHYNVIMEVRLVEIDEIGIAVPMVICLPSGNEKYPGICCFSGHSQNGLRDLVVDTNSYQKGIAVRLARRGFITIAVEKIDAGYLSTKFPSGNDEFAVAKSYLGQGQTVRSHQLKACIVAAEILAAHPRLRGKQLGATGVSLGGWLSVQTALLNDRIRVVADFGRKTVSMPEIEGKARLANNDICHVLPGMLSISQRNLITLAFAPRRLFAGHGRKDVGSHQQSFTYFQDLFEKQYEALGKKRNYSYHIHDGGDTMPADAVLNFFEDYFE